MFKTSAYETSEEEPQDHGGFALLTQLQRLRCIKVTNERVDSLEET